MAETTRNPQMAQFFWNAYSNIQAQVGPAGGYDYNRELLTYIQADDRYPSYVEDYADMKGITGAARDTMIAEARATHDASYQTLDTSPGYSTDMQGLANDFYFAIEQSYDNAPKPVPVAEPVQTVQTVTADPITSRIDTAFAATEDARAEMPGLDAYAARLRADVTPAVPAEDAAPVFTPMGDVAMPAAVTPEAVTPVTTEPATPVQAAEITTPVYNAMGDVVGTTTEAAAPAADTTVATPATPAYDSNFTATQLGSMAATPATGVTETPVTAPIAAADMPVPLPHDYKPEQPEAAPAAEDQSTSRDYTVARGDNMWKIVQREYGLTKPADIQRTVDYIASVNGMGEGTQANHLSIGQVIQLPNSPTPPADTPRLDWAALDAETSRNLRSQFRPAAEGVAAATPAPAPTPEASQGFVPESRPLVVPGFQHT